MVVFVTVVVWVQVEVVDVVDTVFLYQALGVRFFVFKVVVLLKFSLPVGRLFLSKVS